MANDDRLLTTIKFFKRFAKLKPSERVAYIHNNASVQELKFLTELIANFLKGKLKSDKLTVLRIKPYQGLARRLGGKVKDIKVKKNYLTVFGVAIY